MEVTQISTFEESGGAARASLRLHKGLLQEEGVSSRMFVREKGEGTKAVAEYQPSRHLWSRMRRRWRKWKINRAFRPYRSSRPDGLELFSDNRTPYAGDIVRQSPSADVLNLHWIAGFVDIGGLLENTTMPVVWTLHDMNAFTGGCHYNVGCDRYLQSCGQCPQLGSSDDDDLSRDVWKRKRTIYQRALGDNQLQIVTPSTWLATETTRSPLLTDAPVEVIPYGLDHSTFTPRETEGMRTALEIPSDHRIVLFVAHVGQNRRKGFDLLTDALSALSESKVTLLSIGQDPDLEVANAHLHLGKLESDMLLSVFYSLADLFVLPSRQDNLPNTVLEAMACGTPVVGFDTGGIPDMVRPGETGWLAESSSARALREALEQALSDPSARRRYARRCREVVEEEYTLAVQARQYRRLYEELLRSTSDTG